MTLPTPAYGGPIAGGVGPVPLLGRASVHTSDRERPEAQSLGG